VKSEHIFKDRLKFFFQEFLPFLHPDEGELYSYVGQNTSRKVSDKDMPISNTKPTKIKWAELSTDMLTRLNEFYHAVPVEPLLRLLSGMGGQKYVVIPKLANDVATWWGTSEP
jgi:hypothetical protein